MSNIHRPLKTVFYSAHKCLNCILPFKMNEWNYYSIMNEKISTLKHAHCTFLSSESPWIPSPDTRLSISSIKSTSSSTSSSSSSSPSWNSQQLTLVSFTDYTYNHIYLIKCFLFTNVLIKNGHCSWNYTFWQKYSKCVSAISW